MKSKRLAILAYSFLKKTIKFEAHYYRRSEDEAKALNNDTEMFLNKKIHEGRTMSQNEIDNIMERIFGNPWGLLWKILKGLVSLIVVIWVFYESGWSAVFFCFCMFLLIIFFVKLDKLAEKDNKRSSLH